MGTTGSIPNFMVTDMFPDVTVFIKNEAPIVVIEFSTKRPRT